MATILIVEDELLIAGEIARSLERLGHRPLEPVDTSDEALKVLDAQAVELVLMDINIEGDTDGIATALMIRRQYQLPVVFLTARSDPATLNRAKLAQPYGYIVKPFTDDSLRAQLELALYNAYSAPPARQTIAAPGEAAATSPSAPIQNYLFVRKGSAHVRVQLKDILWFESMQNFVRLHTATETLVFDHTLKELEKSLPANFFKTHRCHIVNLDHVQAYEESCLLLGKEYVPVSRSCKEQLRSRLHLVG